MALKEQQQHVRSRVIKTVYHQMLRIQRCCKLSHTERLKCAVACLLTCRFSLPSTVDTAVLKEKQTFCLNV